jgi:hypothetical protein
MYIFKSKGKTTTASSLRDSNESIVKGSGRGGQHQQQPPALGEEGDFAVHASVYGKVQAEDNVNPHNQERKGKKKKLVLALAGLSSYLCSLCAICQSVQARGGIHPTTLCVRTRSVSPRN